MKWVDWSVMLTFSVVLLVPLISRAQTAPVPLPRAPARAPYVQPDQPPAGDVPAAGRPGRPPGDQGAPAARLRYVPLGAVACSRDPAGRTVCGPGVWLRYER
jgi:hypothetical protein